MGKNREGQKEVTRDDRMIEKYMESNLFTTEEVWCYPRAR